MKCLAIKWKELTRTAPAVVVRHLWNFGSCVAVKGVVLISCVCCRLVCLFLRDQWVMLSCCTNCGHLLCWWTCCVEWNVWSDVTDSYHPDACAPNHHWPTWGLKSWRPTLHVIFPSSSACQFIIIMLILYYALDKPRVISSSLCCKCCKEHVSCVCSGATVEVVLTDNINQEMFRTNAMQFAFSDFPEALMVLMKYCWHTGNNLFSVDIHSTNQCVSIHTNSAPCYSTVSGQIATAIIRLWS